MDILYLVDRLENLIASSRKMPLLNQIIVKESEMLTIIETMRTAIPNEIKQARRIVQEKERILAKAQSDATTLLTRSREEADRMLSREGLIQSATERSQEIVQQAQEQAQEMLQQAQEQSTRMQKDADVYATETLQNLRAHLFTLGTDLERTILSIERGLDTLAEQTTEQEEKSDTSPASHSTRRASLANDTIGGPSFPA